MPDPLPSLEKVLGLPLEKKIGQLFMPAAYINDSEENIQRLEKLISEHCIGSLCFFHSPASAATNFEGKREIPYNAESLGRLKELIARYQAAAPYPLLIAMDAEWGLAMRVENTPQYPYALTLAALPEAGELLYETGLRIAADCREAGIHWNLAPVADVNTRPENPVIGYRAFGSDPQEVAARTLQLYRGLQDGGLLTCAKHFPGHGDTATDSHLDLPVLEKSATALEAEEWVPFRALMDAGIPAIMTGHLAVPALDPSGTPASLSAPITQKVLRDQWGYQGLIITDALNMYAASKRHPEAGETAFRAFEAGNDILCYATDIPEAISAIAYHLPAARIDASFRRLWSAKQTMYESVAPRPPSFSPEALNDALARGCLTQLHSQRDVQERFFEEGFAAIGCGAATRQFFRELGQRHAFSITDWDLENTSASDFAIPESTNILLAIAPPSQKPAAAFGMSAAALHAIRSTISQRRVWLYHFGNPYALGELPYDSCACTVLAYQPLRSFQQASAQHFNGELKARGILPVTLKNASP